MSSGNVGGRKLSIHLISYQSGRAKSQTSDAKSLVRRRIPAFRGRQSNFSRFRRAKIQLGHFSIGFTHVRSALLWLCCTDPSPPNSGEKVADRPDEGALVDGSVQKRPPHPTPLSIFFRVFEAFGLVGWDQRQLSRAGPPMASCTQGGPALALLAGPTLLRIPNGVG
jgi:hypothetical protein